MSLDETMIAGKPQSDAQKSPEGESLQPLVEWIEEATAPIVGDDFFQSLVELLATRLGAKTALLTQCPEAAPGRAETLAFWHHGKLDVNIEFDLAGTPCENVIHDGRFCFLPERVSRQFPGWAQDEGGVESFIGVPILDPGTGAVLGHIAVYGRSAMPKNAVAESMFRVIAMRAGAEILRRRAERARLEHERIARQRLHQLAVVSRRASISEMTSAITHEIRQPLTAMKTTLRAAVRILERGDIDPETLRKALDQSLRSVARGEAIIDRLREWAGDSDRRNESIEMQILIDETGQLLASEFARIEAMLDLEFDSALPALKGDSVLLQQVVFNLLRNALEAVTRCGKGGGRIHVQVHGDNADNLIIDVHDSGDGVPDALIEDIFEPFSSTRREGMGIGLSLCRSIVESHGGSLQLVSPRGPTTFRVTLPGVRDQAAATAESGLDVDS